MLQLKVSISIHLKADEFSDGHLHLSNFGIIYVSVCMKNEKSFTRNDCHFCFYIEKNGLTS